MLKKKHGRGAFAIFAAVLTAGSLFAASPRALANGDKGKDGGKIPIIVKSPIITDDGSGKQPAPTPPKKKA